MKLTRCFMFKVVDANTNISGSDYKMLTQESLQDDTDYYHDLFGLPLLVELDLIFAVVCPLNLPSSPSPKGCILSSDLRKKPTCFSDPRSKMQKQSAYLILLVGSLLLRPKRPRVPAQLLVARLKIVVVLLLNPLRLPQPWGRRPESLLGWGGELMRGW